MAKGHTVGWMLRPCGWTLMPCGVATMPAHERRVYYIDFLHREPLRGCTQLHAGLWHAQLMPPHCANAQRRRVQQDLTVCIPAPYYICVSCRQGPLTTVHAPPGCTLKAEAEMPTPPGASCTAHGAQLMSAEEIAKPLVDDEMFALASWKNCAHETHKVSRAARSTCCIIAS